MVEVPVEGAVVEDERVAVVMVVVVVWAAVVPVEGAIVGDKRVAVVMVWARMVSETVGVAGETV